LEKQWVIKEVRKNKKRQQLEGATPPALFVSWVARITGMKPLVPSKSSFSFFFFFLWYWGLNSGPSLRPSTSPDFFFFFEIRSLELFIWAGF
jgi:hypothetical protein